MLQSNIGHTRIVSRLLQCMSCWCTRMLLADFGENVNINKHNNVSHIGSKAITNCIKVISVTKLQGLMAVKLKGFSLLQNSCNQCGISLTEKLLLTVIHSNVNVNRGFI